MCNLPEWLPDLLLLETFGGNWQRYEDAVFAQFYTDFIESRPTFLNEPVYITKNPLKKGKERGFWHCVQEGLIEEDRTPDLLYIILTTHRLKNGLHKEAERTVIKYG
jgi:hypothetical protein